MSAATPMSAPSAELLDLQQLKARVAEALPELVAIRRHLHAHPELSGNEHQTAALVAGELRGLGWRVQEGVGRTGVLAELGPAGGPTLALRVDMDALPVEERTGLPYASLHQGLMHACGHDIHTTVGLGVARILAPLADQLTVPVRLLFQPAEETAQGAAWMLADGAMDQGRCHTRIDATRQAKNHLFVAHLRADRRHRLGHVVAHDPVGAGAADLQHEALEHRPALHRVRDLGVKLHGI